MGELERAKRQVAAYMLEKALKDCHGNQCWAADKLGIHRTTFARQMEELGVFKPTVQRKYRERRA